MRWGTWPERQRRRLTAQGGKSFKAMWAVDGLMLLLQLLRMTGEQRPVALAFRITSRFHRGMFAGDTELFFTGLRSKWEARGTPFPAGTPQR